MSRSIHRLAAQELAEAVRFYRQEAGSGVARRFLAEFERVAAMLEAHPGLGTPTHEDRRTHPLHDFPFSVIYRLDAPALRILVVRHQNRDPDHGAGRS